MSVAENQKLTDIIVADMMISSEKVAHVQINNPLEHALLVLVKSGYSAVPVLDSSYKLAGTIGKTVILDQMLGLERFETEVLSQMSVQEVMTKDQPVILKDANFKDALNKVINSPFICVVDQEGYFDGILTRRAILKNVRKELYSRK